MTAEDIYSQLYERMLAEQEKYREWLLTQSPEEVLNHCYEYAMREDILMVFESSEIDEKHARVLLEKGVTLADIYDDFIDLETDHMQDIRDTIGDCADKIIREAEKGGR